MPTTACIITEATTSGSVGALSRCGLNVPEVCGQNGRASRPLCPQRHDYFIAMFFAVAPAAACSIRDATTSGCETYTAWLPFTSTTVDPARFDMNR